MAEIPADADWLDPEAAWWAKLRRAVKLIDEVDQCCQALNVEGVGWSLEREPESDDGWRYRFRQPRPIPADLAATVGDVIHNLRSALDNAAHFLAVRHVQQTEHRDLSGDEESLTEFPIKRDGHALDTWLQVRKRQAQRQQLYGPQEVRALRCVQPFSLSEEAGLIQEGQEDRQLMEQDLLTDTGHVLNTIWNIDKHRRLPRLSWHSDMTYWSDETSVYFAQPGGRTLPLSDGQTLGTFRRKEGAGRPEEDPVLRFAIYLDDHPYRGGSKLTNILERLHDSLGSWVLPRMFAVAEGHEPPIIIRFGPPAPQHYPCTP